jgi:hypothetical protein
MKTSSAASRMAITVRVPRFTPCSSNDRAIAAEALPVPNDDGAALQRLGKWDGGILSGDAADKAAADQASRRRTLRTVARAACA